MFKYWRPQETIQFLTQGFMLSKEAKTRVEIRRMSGLTMGFGPYSQSDARLLSFDLD